MFTHTHTQPFYCSYEICPEPPGWAETNKCNCNVFWDYKLMHFIATSFVYWPFVWTQPLLWSSSTGFRTELLV